MVERKEYLNSLIQWKEEQVIKVVTGIRRCGKSTLLVQYQSWLLKNNVSENQIISINFEELEYEELLDYKKLYTYLKERLCPGRTTYIFLDEVQKVPYFEKAVDSIYVKPNVDLYITGSNAYLLSGDLATLLTGRYVEIRMLPLSFREFLEITKLDKQQGLAEYLQTGGLPYVASMERTAEKVDTYLEGIYNTVIVRDIEDRQASPDDRSRQTQNYRYHAPENNCQISGQCDWQPCLCPKHYKLSCFQRQKNLSKYGKRLRSGAYRVLHFLSDRAI